MIGGKIMAKQLTILVIVVLLLTVGLSGCLTVDEKSKFIGTWHTSSEYWPYIISFSEDEICKFFYQNESYSETNFTYKIENTSLFLHSTEYYTELNMELYFSFTDDNAVLTLINPNVMGYNDSNYAGIYIKQ